MASVIETTPGFTDAIESVSMQFRVRPEDPQQAPETIADRLEYRTLHAVTRDDNLSVGQRPSDWKHIDDGTIVAFSVGDSADLRALLLKLYNESKSDLGL